jgi:hypothetical protein
MKIFYIPQKIRLILSHPGHSSEEHLIVDDPEGPNVAFSTVSLPLKNLRRHIKRTSDTRFEELLCVVIHILGKAEIFSFIN